MSQPEQIDTLHDYPDDPDVQCIECDAWFPESEPKCPECATPKAVIV